MDNFIFIGKIYWLGKHKTIPFGSFDYICLYFFHTEYGIWIMLRIILCLYPVEYLVRPVIRRCQKYSIFLQYSIHFLEIVLIINSVLYY